MSDTPLADPAALPVSDAPPSSAGHSSPGPPGPVDQPPAAIQDEVKERLDKIVYSEVSCSLPEALGSRNQKAMLIYSCRMQIGITTLLARLKQSVASARVRRPHRSQSTMSGGMR